MVKWNTIYNTNCTTLLKDLLNEGVKFDLILTDPPYNIGKDFNNDSDRLPLKEYLSNMREVLSMCSNLLEDNGSLIWFCTHRYVGYFQTMLYDIGLFYKRMLIWYYLNGMSRQRKTPITEYEPILWFTKSEDNFTYNADDMRIPYRSERVKNPVYKKDSKGVKRAWNPNPLGSLRGDVWRYPVLAGSLYQSERTIHPTQKPEKLTSDLLRAFAPKQGKVLDPYMGSGTTAVCCKKLGLPWIGCEIEQKWTNIANERLK